jgi:hypothetical protein
MHNFVSSEDISLLMTEGRKFGVAFTGAHVERYGQLADNQKIAGATLATINKIFFQLSVPDAQEVAAEVADKPPVEHRRERQYTICKEPVWELLNRGHANKRVEDLGIRYFKPIQMEITRLKSDIEELQLDRMGFLDQATLARDDSSLHNIDERRTNSAMRGRDVPVDHSALDEMQGSLIYAMQQHGAASGLTDRIKARFKHFRSLKNDIFFIDTFLIAIMEGQEQPIAGNKAFAEFLNTVTHCYFNDILKLYVDLSFGDVNFPVRCPRFLQQNTSLIV